MNKLAILAISFLTFTTGTSVKKFKMPRNVSSNLEEERAPYVSMDGKHIIYTVKDTRSNAMDVYYSQKTSNGWTRGIDISSVNKSIKLNLTGGYAISPDGKEVLFTTKKYGGVGGYDIWKTTKKSPEEWTEPENLGKPLNSSSNDAMPSYSFDGNQIYYMRCDELENNKSECCEIYTAKRTKSSFTAGTKVALSGLSCYSTPRVSADGETLYFGGKKSNSDDLDMYYSRKENGKWSPAQHIPELSTDLDDQFCSFNTHAKRVFFADQGVDSWDLYIGELPREHRAKQLAKYTSKADFNGSPSQTIANVYHAEDGTRVEQDKGNERGITETYLAEGNYFIYFYNKNNDFKYDTLLIPQLEKFETFKHRFSLDAKTPEKAYLIDYSNENYLSHLQQTLTKNLKALNDSSYTLFYCSPDSTATIPSYLNRFKQIPQIYVSDSLILDTETRLLLNKNE